MSRDPAPSSRRHPLSGPGAALWPLALVSVVIGVWATLAPASFYEDFILGRRWIALDGPMNVHLIRDVGGLNLALAVVTAAAAVRRDAWSVRVAALANLVYGVPHLAYHATATEPFGTADVVAQLVALSGQVVAPLLLLAWASRRAISERARGGSPSLATRGPGA